MFNSELTHELSAFPFYTHPAPPLLKKKSDISGG